MADGILGLGSSGSLDLNSELLTKLKTAESTSVLDPITAEQEDTQSEIDAVDAVQTMVTELLDLVKDFDLFTSGTNIFDEISASTSGSSASFDATDTSNLEPGTITVNVTQLAQKDVYQSNTISDKTSTMDSGTISISIGDNTYDFSTDGKTYEALVSEMNNYSNLDAALEQVGDSSYRIVIKSSESGLSNTLTITQTDVDLGLEDENNHVLTAQNMNASIDGIDYDLSSNKVTMQNGLIIKAVSEGTSSITMERDDSSVIDAINSVADKYNDLVDLVNSYILGDEENPALISDSSTLKTMMNDIKNVFFGSYGLENEENMFKYGMSFDSSGYMQIDDSELSTALTDNYDDLKELFIGYAQKEGIGTRLKTYLDALDSLNGGLLSTYANKLDTRLSALTTDYDEASAKLDDKYDQMASQFASYTVLITQMENSFASLKSIIDGSSDS
ncbi:MAG: flagellar filament capping protein FliD [Aliarcobacter sp.]|nr:flagellar filament capping protein FliD [Aliarcobacter sp.]MDD2887677.1 flagellar filament capping protein FliD [Aliarcobacter sp.]